MFVDVRSIINIMAGWEILGVEIYPSLRLPRLRNTVVDLLKLQRNVARSQDHLSIFIFLVIYSFLNFWLILWDPATYVLLFSWSWDVDNFSLWQAKPHGMFHSLWSKKCKNIICSYQDSTAKTRNAVYVASIQTFWTTVIFLNLCIFQ